MGYLADVKTHLDTHLVYCEIIQVGTHLGGEQLVAYDPTHTHSKTASVMYIPDESMVCITLGDFDSLGQTRKILREVDNKPLGVSMIILEHFGAQL